MRTIILALSLVLPVGCGNPQAANDPSTGNPDGSAPSSDGAAPGSDGATSADLAGSSPTGDGGSGSGLSPNQKAVAEALTSCWENDTPVLAYAYSENIHDGRGYTSGRAGFCTGTGDAIQVIACYDKLRTAANGNLMAKYMPALTTINNQFMATGTDQGDTSLLDAVGNWITDWGASYNTAATQSDFKSCQDQISDLLYYTPAMQAATKTGVGSALSRAALYDMWINQGDDSLVTKTNSALGVQTAIGVGNTVTEDQWLKKFLELRRDVMAADATWKQAVDRVAGYEKARRHGNWDLSQPIDTAVTAAECWPGGGYQSSGYTGYVIQPDASFAKTTVATSCQ
jgi:chitosanase